MRYTPGSRPRSSGESASNLYSVNSTVVHARAFTSSRVKFSSLKSSGWPSDV